MNHLFVEYPIALRLKHLGFDEPCFGYYNYFEQLTYTFNKEGVTNDRVAKDFVLASTYDQVIEWLDSKRIYLQPTLIYQSKEHQWGYNISDFRLNKAIMCDEDESYNTRKDAIIAGIEKCLDILENQ